MSGLGYRASTLIYIKGDGFDPDSISRLMKLQPSHIWRTGERNKVVRKDGTVLLLKGRSKDSGWKMFCPKDWKKLSIEEQLEKWVDSLASKKSTIQKLRRLGYQCVLDIFVVRADNLIFILQPDLLQKIGSYGFEVKFSFLPS